MRAPRLEVWIAAAGLAGCAQVLGLDDDAHLAATSTSSGGGSTTSVSVSASSSTGTPMCTDCTPDNECLQGECHEGMCTSEPKPAKSACNSPTVSGGVCTNMQVCVECLDGDDCGPAAPVCTPENRCVPASCTNQMQDGDETATDCGGSCANCDDGLTCGNGDDCKSGYCNPAKICAPCTVNGQCGAMTYCDTSIGKCVPTKFNGEPCVTANECSSSRCVATSGPTKICCDGDCAGSCDSCLAAETNAPDGTCAHARADVDPKNACATDVCTTGNCDGFGACGFQLLGTPCTAGTCSGTLFDPPDTCNGTGQCSPMPPMTCTNNAICVTDACLAACAAQTDCVGSFYCDTATTICTAKKATGPCMNGYECVSGVCKANNTCKP